MRQIWRHIATILLGAFTLPVSMMAQPVASWNETLHDFGTFHEDSGKKSCDFIVTNTGDSALVIVQVKSTCGCTVTNHTTQAVLPGQNGLVSATFSPTGRPGPFEKDIWVYTNTSPNRTRLTIKGIVIGKPESVKRHFPESAGDLQYTNLAVATGEVKKGLLRNSTVTAYNSGHDTLVIGFDNNTSHIAPRAVPDTVPPGAITTVSLFFDSSKTPLWGINDDHVTITGTPLHGNDPTSTASVNIIANVVEDFSRLLPEQLANSPVCSASTDRISFSALDSNAPATMQVRNTGKSNLIVRRVMSLDKAITAKTNKTLLKPGEEANITIKVNTSKVEGNILNSQFTIITNDPSNPLTIVRVVGEIGH